MNALDVAARGLAKCAIDTQRLPDLAALRRALGHAPAGASLTLAEFGREGRFTVWNAASFADRFGYTLDDALAADPLQGLFVVSEDRSKIARRVVGNGVWQAAWFGWLSSSSGGTGAGNRDALRAIEALIAYSPSPDYRPFADGAAVYPVVDLGWGEYDLGEPDDEYGFSRVWGSYFGHGFLHTQINWKGAADATVVQWDSSARGFFNRCRFGGLLGYGDNPPKRWIDTSWSGGDGTNNIADWSDNFDNFYTDVSSHPDAAAIVLTNIVNFTFKQVRFQGGTRAILVHQNSLSSNKRGLTIEAVTMDYRNGGDATFSEFICVDITGSGSLVINLDPTRLEGSAAAATGAANNPALVRVRDTVGPDKIATEAVTLNLRSNAGIDFGNTPQFWLMYLDTAQTNLQMNINMPFGALFQGFRGLQGGPNSNTWFAANKGWEPTFSGTGACVLSPWSNTRQSGGPRYLGFDIKAGHTLALGSGGGVVASGAGNPEGGYAAPPGSIYIRTDGLAGYCAYRKNSGTGSTGWVNASLTKGAISATTDASGDILIPHGFGTTPTKVQAKIDGPTLYHTAIHTIGSTTFKARVFDLDGTPQPATTLTGWWEAETTA